MRHHHHQTPAFSDQVRRAGRDPFLSRIGLMILGFALLAPMAMILRTGGDSTLETSALPGATASLELGIEDQAPVPADYSGALVPPDQAAALAAAQTTAAPLVTAASTAAQAAPAPVAVVAPQAEVAAPTPAPVAAAPATTVAAPVSTEAPITKIAAVEDTVTTVAARVADSPNCSSTYDVAAGDYWLGIAKKHEVTLDELFAANNAGATTSLYPDDELCLPANAVAPAERPTTTPAPATTKPAPPSTAKPPTSTTKPAPPSTEAPATTQAKRNYSEDEVIEIIRAVWPDDLEDKAIQIAGRESGYNPRAKNYCCYGLFQLYWDVHKSWMREAGISSAEELYDPQVNAYAAYLMYQRAGGWSPWSQTNYG
jgi:LysM repeat protein